MKETWLTKKVIIIMMSSVLIVAVAVIAFVWSHNRNLQSGNVSIETTVLNPQNNIDSDSANNTVEVINDETANTEPEPAVFPLGQLIGEQAGEAVISDYFAPSLANGELNYVSKVDTNGWTMTFSNVTAEEVKAYKKKLLSHGMTETKTAYGLPAYISQTATVVVSYTEPYENEGNSISSLNISIYGGDVISEHKEVEVENQSVGTESAKIDNNTNNQTEKTNFFINR